MPGRPAYASYLFVTARTTTPYPQPPLHSREGAFKGPAPLTPGSKKDPMSYDIFTSPFILNIFVPAQKYSSQRTIFFPITVYYNTLSASYKCHPEIIATLRKTFSRD